MSQDRKSDDAKPAAEAAPGVPRWPATVALLLIAAIYLFFLSSQRRFGPSWLVPAGIILLLVPLWLARRQGNARLTHWFARALIALVTLAVGVSALFLLTKLPGGKTPAPALLQDAALIWVTNVLVFALWYWEVDGGGPAKRQPGRHASTDFYFPQQQQDDDGVVEGWSPGFIDYLFLAFNTSTAFSPTDTLVLSRRVKVLMMMQASISLVVVAVLAARAINTL